MNELYVLIKEIMNELWEQLPSIDEHNEWFINKVTQEMLLLME